MYNIDFEKKVFEKKSLMAKSDLDEGVTLDAGCGNGRYAFWSSRSAKKVIGIDNSKEKKLISFNKLFKNTNTIQSISSSNIIKYNIKNN